MLVIVPCGSAKQDRPAIAGRMYTGSLHHAYLRYALSIAPPDRVYILSAKYGLLALTDMVTPYNLKMGDPGSVSVEQVRAQAEARGLLQETDVVALGGVLYTRVVRAVWPAATTPFASAGMYGYQKSWMNYYRGRLPPGPLPHHTLPPRKRL